MKSILTMLTLLTFFYEIANAQIPKEKNPLNEKQVSLVPNTPGKAPDYFCTWNVQGYAGSYLTTEGMRENLNQKYIFGTGKNEGWVNFFPSIRKDLYFVMDDSWDIPQSMNSPNDYFGKVELDTSRFPSYTGQSKDRLKKLVTDIKSYGWKGVGGWICAQEAPIYGKVDQKKYWIERLQAANFASFDYWKVDWGKNSNEEAWRKMLTDLGDQYAPKLIIEHAMQNKFIEFSDVFRTYDVENVISQPETVRRIADLLAFKAHENAQGIINCEDEPYIAAGLGCAIGIMRHSLKGSLPNGTQDFAFPPVGRDLKNRQDEVVRGVKWHRIAEPFGVGTTPYEIDSVKLIDYWIFKKWETWVTSRQEGDTLTSITPASISRGLPLPEINNLQSKHQPVVLASKYPNGAIAIVTIGRSIGREYVLNRESVTVKIPQVTTTFGIFGDYNELILVFPEKINRIPIKIYGQDLAGEIPVNLTQRIKIDDNKLIVPGDLIREIGLMAASKGDVSDPGMILKIIR